VEERVAVKKRETWSIAGGDVSAESIMVMVERDNGQRERAEFANDTKGHKRLISWLKKRCTHVRVCIEATGIYSLDLAFALHRAPAVEVMVANPRSIADFGRALMQRSKTDALDAEVILEFVKRMPFARWEPPSPERLNLRAIMRRVTALKQMAQQEKNRAHAAQHTDEITHLIARDVDQHIVQIERHVQKLEAEAYAIVLSQPDLSASYRRLTSIRGIARVSALHILGELAVLANDMSARQWVAHAGLDPRHHDSGTSIHKPARISRAGNRHLRTALFLPAMVAVQHEPNVKAFYQQLLFRGKTKMQALVAVMRKLLHAIHGMFASESVFVGEKFYALAA
jgi:transposase